MQVFALSSGRSGTRFLSHLFRNNLGGGVSRHEPYFDRGNPTLFGRPIHDHLSGRRDRVHRLLQSKRDWVRRNGGALYVETSHALLKSYHDVVLEYFPQAHFVHLVRDPLKTARSEANRHLLFDQWRVPLRYYRERGKRYFRWALTGEEPIFASFDRGRLTLFQWYVIQWIEIENRAMRFIADNGLQDRCFTLHSPTDLNDPDRIGALFDRFSLPAAGREIVIEGHQNRTPGTRTIIDHREEAEFREVVERLPEDWLRIFHRAPYDQWPWAERLAIPAAMSP